ncbi:MULTISPECIES: DUF6817 domain-containing protein [unclassified Streptomyces]|uniref:DUF6817 domain-containing protein n=1 Tax=unclassified Streptomyces TaxID=2593676 RepID=UPI00093C149F|nr:hypothetical protein [Streptomyces sp. TSRI0107]OKJ88065.1 hypothetical protein AMK31_13190 [Streptomyces sp. TSRI0107]
MQARTFLEQLGAGALAHRGGTLLTHLDRVRDRLAAWQARPALQQAGLCHACYGTDGFPAVLLPLDRRAELSAVIGPEAEAIVYLYGSCDRSASYATLADGTGEVRDRFTGARHRPDERLRRDLAELTAANELDLARHDPVFRARWGPELLSLFTRFRPLLSDAAWTDCLAVLGDAP